MRRNKNVPEKQADKSYKVVAIRREFHKNPTPVEALRGLDQWGSCEDLAGCITRPFFFQARASAVLTTARCA